MWNGICAFHSDDGRQIGENNTNPEIYREIVETESKPCKFEGSRYGLPINLTALRNVMASWDDALQLVTTVRGLMIGGPVATSLMWTLVWMAILLIVFVPLALRGYRRRV